MVFSERFMDSYPYEMTQIPCGHHPYRPCFGSGPQMKVEQPRARYGYPSQCHHGCCDDGYFAGPGSRAAYPHCTQPSVPFDHPGGYLRYHVPCRVPHEPEEYENRPRNYGCSGSGGCNHSSGCGKKNYKVGEMMPEVNELRSYPCATMPFRNGYPRKLDEVPQKKRSPNQLDDVRIRPSYPMPLDVEQENSDMRNRNETDDSQEYAEAEAWPWLLGHDPHTRRMNGNGKSKSSGASDVNRSCDGKVNTQSFARPAERSIESHPSKKVKTIEVKDVSKTDQNNETEKVQVGEKKTGKVLDVKLKRTFSDEAAAVLIQSVYRGYDVRRFDLLDKLKKIANIREQAAGVEGRIQSLLTFPRPVDEKQRLILEESIMSLLLKLDGVQGLPPQFREIRKSAARELTRMQERLDSLTMQNSEEVKDEEMSEPLEQCVETNSEELKEGEGNEVTEVERGNESCEAGHQQMLMDQDDSETAIPEQTIEPLCFIMDKENHAEDLRDDEVTDDSEKVAMDVEREVNPEVEFKVNLEAEHEVNPNVGLEVNPNHDPARGCEVEQAELSLSANDDDACCISPESVTLDSGMTEVETQVEGEILVDTLSSTTAAPENEICEAEVQLGGSEPPDTQIDGEAPVVTLPFPAPVPPETEILNVAQKGSDVVKPETPDGGEVLDGTLSSPAAAVQDEVAGGTIGSDEKLVKENEELRKLTEKLMEVTREQSAVISDLNKRVDNLERRLSAKRNKRR